jgi:hypothetical protein
MISRRVSPRPVELDVISRIEFPPSCDLVTQASDRRQIWKRFASMKIERSAPMRLAQRSMPKTFALEAVI